jgi:hypothetical protein
MKTSQIDNEGNIVLVWDGKDEAKLKNKTGQTIDWNYGIDSQRMFDNLVTRYQKNYIKK